MSSQIRVALAAACMFLLAMTGCAARTKMVEGQRLNVQIDESDSNWRGTYRIDASCSDKKTGRTGVCIGTGRAIHESGILLTNRHVIEDDDGALAEHIEIAMVEAGGVVRYPAKVLARSESHDLAVIKIERHLEHIAILADEDEANEFGVLDQVYSIGFPLNRGKDGAVGNIGQMNYSEPTDENSRYMLPMSDGEGHVFMTERSTEPSGPYVLKNDMRLHIDCAPGSSGSGVYLIKNGELVGLVKVLAMPSSRLPYYFEITAEPVSHIREFLDLYKIPYSD